ncbi:hypothetical protein GCM10017567_19650 [Amycolatopsis bullii]|uniref:OmpR/PhoB-type domain-containing protein n=1 Tax=Amycolatopsis bullii TaxID=941987 RepID=A0ABQ3K4U6_9PSEU|nr:hypothetical protein GCM10017567_19650 [Amycolatopsis bullii]
MLGNLEVRMNGASVPVGHVRQKAVLVTLLAEADHVMPPDRLIERVWGARPPARARSVLRTYLSNLRRVLNHTGITITWHDTGYRLAVRSGAVDLHRFRHLLGEARVTGDPGRALALADEALALWRGEPLAELDTPWAHSTREQLCQERAAAEADRIDWALECGRHGELLPRLTARAHEEPLDERLAGQLMLALYRAGRQAEALERYQHTRQRLGAELGIDPGPALQDLHQRILTADPSTSSLADAPRSAVTPRQLPAPPAPFHGRDAELSRLDAALEAPDRATTVVISAIAGAGGIGKTWLALHWAHRNADRFPDGHLFVDLRGFSPDGEPMNPAVAVRGFLDTFGIDPRSIPADPHAQAALFRSLVVDKQMLIVLDNAADTSQVLPLLPGGRSCTVIVTSRNRLSGLITGHGARHLHLDVLTDAEAHAVLTDRLGRARVDTEPAAAGRLVSLCGGFPLALSIIAGHAQTQPRLPLAALAAELSDLGLGALDDDDPTASLPEVLSWSRRSLSPGHATVFALLGIAAGPDISLAAAASLVGCKPSEARTLLRALDQASLIAQDVSGRYHLHDLVRQYAGEAVLREMSVTDRENALLRWVDFHLHTAHGAHRLLDPHAVFVEPDEPTPGCAPVSFSDSAAALAWFDSEHRNLLAAHQLAVTRGRHEAAWQLALALTTFHHWRGHLHDDLVVWQTCLPSADHVAHPAARTTTHRFLGRALTRVRRYEEAAGHLQRALAVAEENGDLLNQAHAHRGLHWVRELEGDDRAALEHALRALALFRTLDNAMWEIRALNNVGWFNARLGRYDEAREYCQAALALHARHPVLDDGRAGTLDTLGFIDHHNGDHVSAIGHYRQALALRRELGNEYEVANTLDNLGYPHAALGQHHHARAAWQEALKLYRTQERHEDAVRAQHRIDSLNDADAAP